MKPMITNLEKLLDGPRDGAMLRFSLGNAWLDEDLSRAVEYYRDAVRLDPAYSAAWKGLGKALTLAGDAMAALSAYHEGIGVAERKGDKQAAKEMTIFARRIEKSLNPDEPAAEDKPI